MDAFEQGAQPSQAPGEAQSPHMNNVMPDVEHACSDWTMVDSTDCASDRSFSPTADPADSPRSDMAADLVLGQPLPPDFPVLSPAASAPSLPGLCNPKLPRRPPYNGVHIPDLLCDLTPTAVVAAAASMWIDIARAWLKSAREAVAAVNDAAAAVVCAAACDASELARSLARAVCGTGGALEAALGASRTAGAAARQAAANKAALLHANFTKAYKNRAPPSWALLSMGLATTVSLAAAGTLAVANRSLTSQLRQRDRELAHLVLSIVNLQEALQSSRASTPLLRHVSLAPTYTVSSLA
mmetsp:Transcript_3577/g.9999  ORF Transcript_3577/g.9999 Transcript_3577/m.9999 type:complete len:298 (-) Transcript_3577:471-1364(-)